MGQERWVMVREQDAAAHEALSRAAQKVLRLYVSEADPRGVALYTQKDTATKLALSRPAVQRALGELTKAGFLVQVGYGCVAVNRQRVTTSWRPSQDAVEAHEFFERIKEVARSDKTKGAWRRPRPRKNGSASRETRQDAMPKPEDVPY